MRHYYIYLLHAEVGNSYFGKEKMIYQLFLEAETATNELKDVVRKQINYIVTPIPSLQIRMNLDKMLKIRSDLDCIEDHFYLDLKSLDSKAVLKDHGYMITISASGTYEAETIFFEVLRKINRCFFAMDFENNNYGWLNPVKQVNYI